MSNSLYSYELDNMLHCLFRQRRQIQFDVLCSNELNNYNVKSYPLCLIVNNQECGEAGEHWTCFYKKSLKSALEFFCSYGNGVQFYGKYFEDFQKRNSANGFVENHTVFQSSLSSVCGLYVIFYLYQRQKNVSRSIMFQKFTRNVYENDRLVMFYVKKIATKNQHKFSKRCRHLFQLINKRLYF